MPPELQRRAVVIVRQVELNGVRQGTTGAASPGLGELVAPFQGQDGIELLFRPPEVFEALASALSQADAAGILANLLVVGVVVPKGEDGQLYPGRRHRWVIPEIHAVDVG